MRLKIIKNLLLVMTSLSYTSYSQIDCYKEVLTIPSGFEAYVKFSDFKKINNDYSYLDNLIKKGEDNPSSWVVYSDRDNNRLYRSANRQELIQSETLEFLDPLYVLEHKNGWLKIVRRNEFDQYCSQEEDYDSYWVQIDNLILNSFALTNELNNPRKGMILVSVENLANNKLEDLQAGTDLEKYFYLDPRLKNKSGEAKKFEIYFILKTTDSGKILLSSSDDLTSISDSKDELKAAVKGWVSDDIVTPWDSKVCLEVVSQETNAYAYDDYLDMDGQPLPIPIYKFSTGITNFLDDSEGASVNNDACIKLSTPRVKKPPAYMPRMPILENFSHEAANGKTLTYHKVACIAGMDTDGADYDLAEIAKQVQVVKKRTNNLDILFVVDATKSMAIYFPSISKAIKEIMAEQQGKAENLRFALSLYRHKLDGDLACETIPLTDNPQDIYNKLNQKGICFSKNTAKDNESQFYGIMRGVEQARFNKEHSNLMILIGDCGNDSSDGFGIKLENVIDKINRKNINVVSFQVIDKGRDAHYEFKDNIQDILKVSAKNVLNGSFKDQVELKKSNSVTNTKILNFANFESSNNNPFAPKFGRYTFASGGKQMDAGILRNNIKQATSEYMSKIKATKAKLENILDGNTCMNSCIASGKKSCECGFTPETVLILKSPPYNFTDDQIELLQDQGDISMMGYTSLNLYGNSSEAFVHSAFMTAGEHRLLIDLYATLADQIANSNATSLRRELQDAMIQLSKTFIDPNISNTLILNKTFGQVWEELTGIPLKSGVYEIISNCKLRDLTVRQSLSDKEFDHFIEEIEPSLLTFSNGRGHSKYRWDKNGTSYYFLPIDKIPGW